MKLLIDLRTGEPVVDLEGKLKEIKIARAFSQYVDVLLNTPIMTEQLAPNWGLDVRGIMEASAYASWEGMIEYLVANAFSQQNEPLIESIEAVEVSRDSRELTIEVHVTSKYGTVAKSLVSLNV